MVLLNAELKFPSLDTASPDGLLAIGGDLSTARLVLAYRSGIFPWYNPGEIIQWWSPDPRFVLFPEELKISKSMQKVLRSKLFKFTMNRAFKPVVVHCMEAKRSGQDGSWIGKDIIAAYTILHQQGIAHSAEVWHDGKLVGGVYGIKLGNVFFGESMFSNMPNASKFAFINYVRLLQEEGIKIIDCQVYTSHLESLGARMISRSEFQKYLPAASGV